MELVIQQLCSYLLALIVCCVAADHPLPDVTAVWGSGKFVVPCFREQDRGVRDTGSTTYWNRIDGAQIATRFNGEISYVKDGFELNDDGLLTLPEYYTSAGEYECTYSRPKKSFLTTLTRVSVSEPPLRVLECNGTDHNKSSKCWVLVPNGTQSLWFNAVKAGLRTNDDIELHLQNGTRVLPKTVNKTRNQDNSTTISTAFKVDVNGLMSSMTLRISMDGSQEEINIVLNKAQQIEDPDNIGRSNKGSTIAIAVIVCLAVICIAGFVWAKFHRQILRELRRRREGRTVVANSV